MRGAIVAMVAIVVIGFAVSQFSKMVKAKMDMTDRVEHYIDLVDETAIDSVKDDLVKDAAKFGVELSKEKVLIVYEDTEKELYQQRLVGKIAEFKNKQAGISLSYQWHILGFGVAQDITRTKIKQVRVQQKERPEYKELSP